LCPRGTGGVGAHFDPDRLRTPLVRRTNARRGQEEWAAVTWDEALNVVAAKMEQIRARHGPEAIALFSHGIGGTFLKHTVRAFGSPNIAAPSFAQCRGPRDVGFALTFGEEVGSPERTDIRNARCLVLIGSHLGENMHNTQAQEFADAVGGGASIIVVDPRYSVAASKAKHYLPIKPGTDLALLLAWMHVIANEELYDKPYVEAHGFGFDAFKAELSAFTPEWAYPETGIEPRVIRETAHEMVRYKPATLVHPGRHATWYGDDTQRSRAIALLNALLGSWGRKGGFYAPTSMDVPGYPYPPYPESKKGKVDNPGARFPFASEAISTGIRDATLTGKPYPVRGWLTYATNLIHALPNEAETVRAIESLGLLVVVDVIPSETAGWADVVLPETVYLERYDDINGSSSASRCRCASPLVHHDSRTGGSRGSCRKLGLAPTTWKDIGEIWTIGCAAPAQGEGIIHGPKAPVYFEEGVVPSFATPSGKIEFYSTALGSAGFDPVPRYVPPSEPPAGFFRLLYGRAPVHSFSRTQSNPILFDMMGENEVWLNRGVAERLGLKSGEYVRLRNQDGVVSNRVKVRRPSGFAATVCMVHGFGHTSPAQPAEPRCQRCATLITRTPPIPMGGTGMNVNFVTFQVEA
jgi:thiosulfate reductase/polysulfide reductase chain A